MFSATVYSIVGPIPPGITLLLKTRLPDYAVQVGLYLAPAVLSSSTIYLIGFSLFIQDFRREVKRLLCFSRSTATVSTTQVVPIVVQPSENNMEMQ